MLIIYELPLKKRLNSFPGKSVIFFVYKEFPSYFLRALSCYKNNTNNTVDSFITTILLLVSLTNNTINITIMV